MFKAKNKIAGLTAASLSLFALAGCGGGGSPAAEEDSACQIGLSITNQQDVFFARIVEGAEEAAAKVNCELSVANADNDPAKQSSDVRRLVTQGVDGVIVTAIDANGIVPAVDDAMDQGVEVVAVDTNFGEEHYTTFVGVENDEAAANFGQYMVERGFSDGARYGIVDATNSLIQNLREDAFRKVVDDAGAEFTQAVSGDNQMEKAQTAAQNLLTAQENLDFIYTTGTPATAGAVSALDGQTEPKIVGWDLNAEIIQGIDSGIVQAVVQQNSYKEGEVAVNEMKSILEGEDPAGYISVPVTIVTKENIDEYRDIYS